MKYILKVCFFLFLLLSAVGFSTPVFSQSSDPENQREIMLNTQFLDEINMSMQISTSGFLMSNVTIVDQNDNVVYNWTGNPRFVINTPVLMIERGKPYFLMTEDAAHNKTTNVFYCSENILESIPFSCWLGENYQENYNEYLDVFERAYKILLNLTRNGKEIETGGVTINRVPRSVAYGGNGKFTYAIWEWFEYPFIKEKVYLPGNTAIYTHPEYGTGTMSARLALSTRFHELAHAVLLETIGNDPFPQEGIACYFEIELFRLLDYRSEYIDMAEWSSIYNFQLYVGGNHETIATEFMKAYEHVGFGAWIAAYLLQDFVGYGEFESDLNIPAYLVPDFGWTFLEDYFRYSTIFQPPPEYNINERLLYFFELASGVSLKQHFTSWGFNITDYYKEATYQKYHEEISIESKSYSLLMFTNSTISNFYFNQSQRTISFDSFASNGTDNFCNIAIPMDLLDGDLEVYQNESLLLEGIDYTLLEKDNYFVFYIGYTGTYNNIHIIPEFPSWIILSLLLIAILVIVIYKKKLFNQPSKI